MFRHFCVMIMEFQNLYFANRHRGVETCRSELYKKRKYCDIYNICVLVGCNKNKM